MVYIFGGEYSLTLVLPVILIILILVFFLTTYIRDNFDKIKLKLRKKKKKEEKKIVINFHREFTKLKKEIRNLSTNDSLQKISVLTKRYIADRLDMNKQFTFEELPRDKLDWSVIELTKRISDLKYSGKEITRDEINHLLVYLSKVIKIRYKTKEKEETHTISIPKFPKIILPKFPKIKFKLPKRKHIPVHHKESKPLKPIKIHSPLPKRITIDLTNFFRREPKVPHPTPVKHMPNHEVIERKHNIKNLVSLVKVLERRHNIVKLINLIKQDITNTKKALKYYNKAERINKTLPKHKRFSTVLNKLHQDIIKSEDEIYKRKEIEIQKIIKLKEEKKLAKIRDKILDRIKKAQKNIDNYDKALFYYKRSFELSKNLPNRSEFKSELKNLYQDIIAIKQKQISLEQREQEARLKKEELAKQKRIKLHQEKAAEIRRREQERIKEIKQRQLERERELRQRELERQKLIKQKEEEKKQVEIERQKKIQLQELEEQKKVKQIESEKRAREKERKNRIKLKQQERERRIREKELHKQRKIKLKEEREKIKREAILERQRRIKEEQEERQRLIELKRKEKEREIRRREHERKERLRLEELARQNKIKLEQEEKLRKQKADEEEKKRQIKLEKEKLKEVRQREIEKQKLIKQQQLERERLILLKKREKERAIRQREHERRKRIELKEQDRRKRLELKKKLREDRIKLQQEAREREIQERKEREKEKRNRELERQKQIRLEQLEQERQKRLEEKERLEKLRQKELERQKEIRKKELEKHRRIKEQQEEKARQLELKRKAREDRIKLQQEREKQKKLEEIERQKQLRLKKIEEQKRLKLEREARLKELQLKQELKEKLLKKKKKEKEDKLRQEELERQRKIKLENLRREKEIKLKQVETERKAREQARQAKLKEQDRLKALKDHTLSLINLTEQNITNTRKALKYYNKAVKSNRNIPGHGFSTRLKDLHQSMLSTQEKKIQLEKEAKLRAIQEQKRQETRKFKLQQEAKLREEKEKERQLRLKELERQKQFKLQQEKEKQKIQEELKRQKLMRQKQLEKEKEERLKQEEKQKELRRIELEKQKQIKLKQEQELKKIQEEKAEKARLEREKQHKIKLKQLERERIEREKQRKIELNELERKRKLKLQQEAKERELENQVLKFIRYSEQSITNLKPKVALKYHKKALELNKTLSHPKFKTRLNKLYDKIIEYAEKPKEIPIPTIEPEKKVKHHHKKHLSMFEKMRINSDAKRVLELIKKAEKLSMKYPLISKRYYDRALMIYYNLPLEKEEDISIKLSKYYDKVGGHREKELLNFKHANRKSTKEAISHLKKYRNYVVIEQDTFKKNLKNSVYDVKKHALVHMNKTKDKKTKHHLKDFLNTLSKEEHKLFNLEEQAITNLLNKTFSLNKHISEKSSKEAHDTNRSTRRLFSTLNVKNNLPIIPEPPKELTAEIKEEPKLKEDLVADVKLTPPKIKIKPKVDIKAPELHKKRISDKMTKLLEEKEAMYNKLKEIEGKELDRFKQTRRMSLHDDIGYREFISDIQKKSELPENKRIKKLFDAK